MSFLLCSWDKIPWSKNNVRKKGFIFWLVFPERYSSSWWGRHARRQGRHTARSESWPIMLKEISLSKPGEDAKCPGYKTLRPTLQWHISSSKALHPKDCLTFPNSATSWGQVFKDVGLHIFHIWTTALGDENKKIDLLILTLNKNL